MAQVDFDKQQIATETPKIRMSNDEVEESAGRSGIPPPAATDAAAAATNQSPPPAVEMVLPRQWFSNLNSEETMTALTIEDDRVWHVLLLASSSTTTKGGGANTSHRSKNGRRTNVGGGDLDWEMEIPLVHVHRAWGEVKDDDDDDEAPVITLTAHKGDDDKSPKSIEVAEAKDDDHTNKTMQEDVTTTKEGDAQPDAFRIRSDGKEAAEMEVVTASGSTTTPNTATDSTALAHAVNSDTPTGEGATGSGEDTNGKTSTQNAATTTASSGTNNETHASSNRSTLIRSFMKNTVTIFPAALDIETAAYDANTTAGEATQLQAQQQHSTPYIALQPSYIQSITSDDLLLAIDKVMAMASSRGNDSIVKDDDVKQNLTLSTFLDIPSTLSASASFLDHVRLFVSTTKGSDASNTVDSIPLYMLMLLRLQFSAAQSYQSHLNNTKGKPDPVPSTSLGGEETLHDTTLSLFVTRIRELEQNDSGVTKPLLARLGKTMPLSSSSGKDHPRVEDYLVLPFATVATQIMHENEHCSEESDLSLLRSWKEDLENAISGVEIQQVNEASTLSSSSDGVILLPLTTVAPAEDDNGTVPSTGKSGGPEDVDVMQMYSERSENALDTSGNPTLKSKGRGRARNNRRKKKSKKKKALALPENVGTVQTEIQDGKGIKELEEESELKQPAISNGLFVKDIVADEPFPDTPVSAKGISKAAEDIPETGDDASPDKSAVSSPSSGSVDEEEANEDAPYEGSVKCEHSAPAPSPEIKERPDLQPSTPTSSTGEDETSATANISASAFGDSDSKNTGDVKRPEGQSLKADPKNDQETKEAAGNDDANLFDDGEWETVGSRSRTNRKKKNGERNSNSGGRAGSQLSSVVVSTWDQSVNSKKKKDREARKRLQTRKIAREILSCVLDSVEEEVERLRANSARATTSGIDADANADRFSANAGNNKPPVASVAVAQGTGRPNPSEGAMRDTLVGKRVAAPVQASQSVIPSLDKPMKYADCAQVAAYADSGTGMAQPKRADRGMKAAPHADQNTIPTVPETVSAVSAVSAYTPSISNVTPRPAITRSTDSASEGSDVAQKATGSTTERAKGASPSPPLPTLLNPGNNNSSSSSVTSSLDAPHATEHGSHAHPSEDDVGVHLLDVCRRLSNDVSVFMQRREEALKVRRSERRLVLLALEGCLGTLWPGMCSVEMYGSCATNLDLPSSDLDVVVRGLDKPRPQQVESASSPSKSEASSSESDSATPNGSFSTDEGLLRVNSQPVFPSYGPEQQHQFSPHHHHVSPHHAQVLYGRMSLNAERVVRLSMELERQPWAVHVKAIPTATVPVIKILADPARVPGAPLNASGDWFSQHAPLAGQSAAPSVAACSSSAADPETTNPSKPRAPNQAPMAHYPTGEAPPLWRGADVNNGLLNVDITFEGPEHGGIGSTKFSARVVEEFAKKMPGLTPEETPEVQALMVLKELLAQRRLNEPFTGGLSSYALLLLVVSVLKERGIIREELYKAECQRRNVAAGRGNSALVSPMPTQEPSQTRSGVSSGGKLQKKKDGPPKPEGIRTNVSRPRSSSEVVTGSGGKVQTNKEPESDNGKNSKGRPDGEMGQSAMTEGHRTKKLDLKAQTAAASLPKATPAAAPPSSWVSIARQNSGVGKTGAGAAEAPASAPQPPRKVLNKPSSFADAVAKGMPTAPSLPPPGLATTKTAVAGQAASNENLVTGKKTKEGKKKTGDPVKKSGSSLPRTHSPTVEGTSTGPSERKNEQVNQPFADRGKSGSGASTSTLQERVKEIVTESNWNKSGSGVKKDSKSHSETTTPSANLNSFDASMFPHGFHDVIEVLCSGETTPGKLLMHFLLFYGQHFDSHSTVIDYSGTHPRDMSAKGGGNLGYSLRSPYMKRQSSGSYDPLTGMLTVDPIVVYDPLEGSESNNVARSCFLWSNVRWVFTQSYMTLSNAVEYSQGGSSGHGATEGGNGTVNTRGGGRGPAYGHDESGNVVVDPNSPLLELLLSF